MNGMYFLMQNDKYIYKPYEVGQWVWYKDIPGTIHKITFYTDPGLSHTSDPHYGYRIHLYRDLYCGNGPSIQDGKMTARYVECLFEDFRPRDIVAYKWLKFCNRVIGRELEKYIK